MNLEDLIESIDIVEYISQYVELEEKNGEYWGLSPFKEEVTPSFSVRRETNRFFDFSSGIGGNLYTFVRFYNRCSSKEAVEILKKYSGRDGEVLSQRKKLSSTIVFDRYAPKKTPKKTSKITIHSENCLEKFEKKEDKLQIWINEGISRESLDRFQVYYDRFSNRLVYPIRRLDGKIVNIGGRTLDPQWKEKNLRKYTYFSSWGEMSVIYGLYENMKYIKEKKEVILFEGCKSVLLADTWGIRNCGAILTSHLNPKQLEILMKLGVRVVFALDKDVRIRDDHNIAKLKHYVKVEYIHDFKDLLSEKDAPVDKGLSVFKELYEQRLLYR